MKIYYNLKRFKNGIDIPNYFLTKKSLCTLRKDSVSNNINEIEIKISEDLDKAKAFCSSEIKPEGKIVNRNIIKDLQEITKFKLSMLNSLVSVSTYCLYATTPFSYFQFAAFICGTSCISMTTQVLNQIYEKKFDANMIRTHNRPMPKNRFSHMEACFIGGALYSSSILFYSQVPFFISAVACSNLILALYIFVYTPYKRINNLSMHIGALVGALPAILGSVAAINSVPTEALLLAGYIFCWQYPHFYGILYPNREDYKRAGFKFIATDSSKDEVAYKQIILGMIGMLLCVYALYKKGIITKPAFILFCVSYAYKIKPIMKFTSNPVVFGKIIRIRSYTPFLIVLLSFLYNSIKRVNKQ